MDNLNSNPLYVDPQQQVKNTLEFNQEVLQVADPLSLEITDDDLVQIGRDRVKASQKFFEEKYNLTERRQKNEKYLFGRQIDELEKKGKFKDYEARSSDNAIYEIEGSLKSLAVNKFPDIIVTPGGDDQDREESARNLTLAVDDMNKTREMHDVLALGFKHLPVYLTAVVKTRWNPDKGIDGDSEFFNVNPEYIVVDHTCVTRNVDDMSFIAQCTPMTVQELIMKFPSKKQQIFEKAKLSSVQAGVDPSWKDLASELKPWEIWFDWYKKKGSKELLTKSELSSVNEPGIQWERIAGLMWILDDLLLDKMMDPNFDHSGEEKLFAYGTPGDETTKQEVQPQDLLMAQLMGQPLPQVSKETIYHNYFDRPHKPFYFFGFDQWGKVYLDETSRVEQNIRNQENLDDQNKNILDQIKTRVKHIWSRDSSMTKGQVQRLDMDDPKMDVLVDGNPNDVHAAVMPERPDAAQFNALKDTRDRMYAISHTTAIRGDLQSDVATSNQLGREGDFSVSDDLTDATITSACEWMAQWRMQFIKLRYTKEHLMQILGAKGEVTYIRLRRDSISDGMEVMVKASSTDKLKAQRNAMQTAGLGPPFTNPIDFFQDMDMNDPEGRTERGMMFQADPSGYFARYVLKLDTTQQQVQSITGGGMPQQAQASMGQPMPGQQAQPQQNPSPQNPGQVASAPPVTPQASPRTL